uniref:Uncharacterized protein n=1 Tax=Arion vulgaris TaxID=1028688 RepID=A0A0B6ZRR4_9EUPU
MSNNVDKQGGTDRDVRIKIQRPESCGVLNKYSPIISYHNLSAERDTSKLMFQLYFKTSIS